MLVSLLWHQVIHRSYRSIRKLLTYCSPDSIALFSPSIPICPRRERNPRIHVGYDGQKFSGLPDTWMDSLLRDISEADQKKNPNAVVTALRFYAASMKEKEKAKFMTTTSVYNASDEDSDDVIIQLNGHVTGHHALGPVPSVVNG
uniref:CRIB domain-containing protein n=1 Tax=Angiostrongylus cantonensis TaxID=6313 RepID=A0A0K0DQ66_ANGCA